MKLATVFPPVVHFVSGVEGDIDNQQTSYKTVLISDLTKRFPDIDLENIPESVIDSVFDGVFDPPDWQGFRLTLMVNVSFSLWSELLPNTFRENIKLAAVLENAVALQQLLDAAIELVPPSPENNLEWQTILDQFRIPVSILG